MPELYKYVCSCTICVCSSKAVLKKCLMLDVFCILVNINIIVVLNKLYKWCVSPSNTNSLDTKT